MNVELEHLIDMALADGIITEKKREIILRKAESLGEDKDEVEIIIDGKIALKIKENNQSTLQADTKINPNSTRTNNFKNQTNVNNIDNLINEKIPIWVGWLINVFAWVLFISTFNHTIEITMGILCLFILYLAYVHNKREASPLFGIDRLSAKNLIYVSAFNAIWMFSWGFGIINL